MFPGLGTLINVGAILLGSLVGIFIGQKLSDKLRNLITDVLGCVTVISAADALTYRDWETKDPKIGRAHV